MLVTAYTVVMSGFDLSAGMRKYAVEDSNGLTSKINEKELIDLELVTAKPQVCEGELMVKSKKKKEGMDSEVPGIRNSRAYEIDKNVW